MQKKKNRIFYLDVLRALACLCVVMIHTNSSFFIKNIGSFDFWVSNTLNSLSRIGVPLFVMISGTLMLDSNYEFSSNKLIKHIIRMIMFYVFWSAIYCILFNILLPAIQYNTALLPTDIISSLINGWYHLWFVFLIIGLYLIVPLLRLWVNDNNKKYVEYFIVLSIIFTFIIPQIITICSYFFPLFKTFNTIIENKLQLKYIGGFTAYFILGWYLHNYNIKHTKLIYILGFIGFLITCIGTYVLSHIKGRNIQLYENLTINVFLQSIAVFTFVKNKFINKKEKNNKIICSISKYSLGIYAIHVSMIYFSLLVITHCTFNRYFVSSLIYIPIIFTVSFILSYLCSFIISKIPFLKNLV